MSEGDSNGRGAAALARRALPWVLVLLLGAAALAVRLSRRAFTAGEDGIYIWDTDTVRRLARLHELEAASRPYPRAEHADGYPAGSVSHWTLPMDWVIRALDRAIPARLSGLRRNEAGALWAGPILGLAGVLLFAWLAMVWLGPWQGLLCALIYAFSTTMVELTSLGNGDHQNLQHLALVLAVLLFALGLAGRGSRALWILAGAALGLALWVSAESMAALVLLSLGAFAHLVAEPRGERRKWVQRHFLWSLTCLAVCALAARIEHPGGDFAFTWDAISLFQLYLAAIFPLFLVLLVLLDRSISRPRALAPFLAALGALSAAALPFLASASLNAALTEQLHLMQAANRWTQAMVREYMPLFSLFGVLRPGEPMARFTLLFYALPLFLAGFLLDRRLALRVRLVLGIFFAGSLALTCLETKLAHLFMITYPIAIVAGGAAWLARLAHRLRLGPRPRRVLAIGATAAVAAIVLVQAPPTRIDPDVFQRARMDLVRAVRALDAGAEGAAQPPRRAVLAIWWLGAHLIYDGAKPVVASNYHRNLAGIHDSFRVLASRDPAAAFAIMRRRGVRWIISDALPYSFLGVEKLLPALGKLVELVDFKRDGGGGLMPHFRFSPLFAGTLYRLLQVSPSGTGPLARFFEEVYASPQRIPGVDAAGKPQLQPVFRVFRVHYPEELGGG